MSVVAAPASKSAAEAGSARNSREHRQPGSHGRPPRVRDLTPRPPSLERKGEKDTGRCRSPSLLRGGVGVGFPLPHPHLTRHPAGSRHDPPRHPRRHRRPRGPHPGTGFFKPLEVDTLREVLDDYHGRTRPRAPGVRLGGRRPHPRLRLPRPGRDDRPHVVPVLDRRVEADRRAAASAGSCSRSSKRTSATTAAGCC